MRDSEIVAAIVAGNPEGLAAAYDRYAPLLYAYCCSLLSEPDDTANAVQDTFIIAASKLAGLRDRDRLRPWLYAVARNECYRRLRARARAAGLDLDEAGHVADDSAASVSAEHAELRELASAALAGLSSEERELIELNLRHNLQGGDLADALGVSVNYAHALTARARTQFETSLGTLLVAHSGRASCAGLDGLLAGRDSPLTVPLRKRLNRHMERCDICGERKRRELRPAILLGLLPVAALPDSLRRKVFRLVSDDSARRVSHRDRVVRRAEPFGRSGFPVPVQRPGPARLHRRYALAAVAAVVLFGTLGGTVVAMGLLQSGAPRAAAAPHSSRATAPATTAAPAGTTTASASATPSTIVTTTPSAMVPAAPPPTTPAATPRPSRTRTHRRPPPPRTPPPTPPGTLSESPAGVTLATPSGGGPPAGSFTLTANGGRVASYTISVPDGLAPGLAVSPSSGSLAEGESVTITVTWNGQGSLDAQLTVDPGGLKVNVSYQGTG